MKILAIRLKNLASLAGPFEIDFTAQPLASAGLFAITGPTGAGKSTVLDALCLALFGAVPRLSNTSRDAKVPDADGDIGTSDPRTLLRRGTGEGYAEVDFIGIDGRRYSARWEANRARNKAGGKLQASRQTLRDLDSEQLLASQKGDYKTALEARLGLNFEQFTRAVLLAQSEFSAFLKSDDKERAELLEKLTDTAIYSQLSRRAFLKSKEAEEAYRALKNSAGNVQPLEPQARADLDQRLAEAQLSLKGLQQQLKQLELQQQWLKELQQLQSALDSAVADQHGAQAAWHQQAEARLQLQRLEQLAPQRHSFLRHAELAEQLNPIAEAIAEQARQAIELHTREAESLASQQQAAQALDAALQQQTQAAPALRQAFDEHSNQLRLATSLEQAMAARLAAEQASNQGQAALQALLERQQLGEQRVQQVTAELEKSLALAPLSDAWSAYREQLQQLMQVGNRLNKGQAELAQLEAAASTAARLAQEQRAALDILYQEAETEPGAISEQIQTLGSLLQDNRKEQRGYEALQRLWITQRDLDASLADVQAKQQDAHQRREQLTASGLDVKGRHSVAEQTLLVTRQLLERQRLARSESVEELRTQLEHGQPCPVCGSAEHPWHQPEALLESLGRNDEKEEAQARKAVEALSEELQQLRADVAAVIAEGKSLNGQKEQLTRQHHDLLPQLANHEFNPRLQEQAADKRDAWLNHQLNRLTHSIEQDEKRQHLLLAAQQDAARQQQGLQAAIDASQFANQQLAEQNRALASDRDRQTEQLNTLAPLLPADTLQRLRDDSAATFLEIDQHVSLRREQQGRLSDERQELAERQQAISEEQYAQQARVEQLATLASQVSETTTQRQAGEQRLCALLGEHADADAWQARLQQAVEHARQAEQNAGQARQALAHQQVQLAEQLKARQERLHALEQEHQVLEAKIATWRAQHPELDDTCLNGLLGQDDNQVSEQRQNLLHSEKALEQSRVLVAEREERLARHKALAGEALPPEHIDETMATLHEQLTAHEHTCAELRAEQADDQRRSTANLALQESIKTANGEYQRWARLNALIGSATGDTFRKIAQAYNLDLLVHHANAQLRQLARRYRLKRGGSMLGLLVQDTEMGDELRSVHSLSGGETFLVSLALALGLASMASSTLKIESLFIDEGFGSLDPQSLQLAMDALDALQAQGRKVGVISHVQEMHERIPVQIQVRRQGNGLSDIEVVG